MLGANQGVAPVVGCIGIVVVIPGPSPLIPAIGNHPRVGDADDAVVAHSPRIWPLGNVTRFSV